MNNALLITLIGGGMVFVGLILLWGMMDVLVKLTAGKDAPVEVETASEETAGSSESSLKAAAAATAVALALHRVSLPGAASADKSSLSPWLSLGRNRQINSSTAFARRKKG